MIVPGFSVSEEVARRDWFALYRGVSETDARPVLLKTAPGRESLAREFELLRGLEIDGLARVVELVNDGEWLVLEDTGGSPARALFNPFQPNLELFFTLAGRLVALLGELHEREIVLNCLAPDGLLYDPATGQICLFDLSCAAETQALRAAGALRYLAPEQTRRMNRAVDYRADFYSLGAVFYEWLTGRPPFEADDALELMHAHLAKTPAPPAELNPLIPAPLNDIVLKLLAKTAGQRYQSAAGLQADLETCARRWAASRSLAPFALGQADFSDKFNIPQALYGRDGEVKQLLDAFAGVADGATSLLLVAGYSGIGKTSLIEELHSPIVQRKGYFISGKFDQVARGTPFGALLQAFRGFARQLLTESDARLERWRERLAGALGANGGVVAEVVPEIELIIGKQPPPHKLGPTETLNRFRLVLQNFVGAVAQRAHPLVLFLDDLQWADPATLSLLEPLLTSGGARHFLLLGAYRDNETDAAHPLTRTLGLLETAGVNVRRLTLGAMQLPDLTRFVADTLRCDEDAAAPLARLVWDKTAGNPFFVIQFLQTLRQENLVVFDRQQRQWVYRLDDVQRAAITDNVADLMTRKINQLAPAARHTLTLAACLGSLFDGQTLAAASGQPPDNVAAGLQAAAREGLLTPALRGYETRRAAGVAAYNFVHDRVQQAAYALLPDAEKWAVHLSVGRLLHSLLPRKQVDGNIFAVVHHLNRGRALMNDADELRGLARLNLDAGRRAKSSAAFEAALGYFAAGARLADETQADAELAFALQLERAEGEYLCGHFDEAEAQLATLRERAGAQMDKAKVLNLAMLQRENQARYADAIAVARENLAQFGVVFPASDEENQAALEREIAAIESLLGGRGIASLIDLPEMRDAETQMVMHILTDIWASTYITGDAALARLISATMVRLSLAHGNVAESAYGYVTHAITVGPARGDYAAAHEFGRLALAVNERFNDARRRAKIHQQFHAHVCLWREPHRKCLPHAREACRSGLEAGDFLYAAYGAHTETWPAHLVANDLAQFVRDYAPGLALIRKLQVTSFADAHNLMLHWARALQGETDAPASLSSADFDEEVYAATYRDNPFFTMFHTVVKMQLAYLFGAQDDARQAAERGRGIVHHLAGTIWPVIFDFWHSLIRAEHTGGGSHIGESLAELEAARQRLSVLAENCPENYLCWSLLVAAEIERVKHNELAALDLYERACACADETKLLSQQALANELYGKFWLRRGQTHLAAVFLAVAARHYAAWGARAKVADLEKKYSRLAGWQSETPQNAPDVDIFSVTKAAQAIAGEMEREKLLAALLKIALENAGAEQGCLLLAQDGELFVHAEGAPASVTVSLAGTPLAEARNLAHSVVNYVHRTHESVVLDDARRDKIYAHDPDVARRQPLSLMCVPVVNQGRLIGLLYLENNVAAGAFTPARARVCQILAAQAAIALENARLYDEMRQEAAQRRQTEETLRSIMLGTAAVTGDNFLALMVRHLADALQVRYAFVTECRDFQRLGGEAEARMLAFWQGDKLAENVSYKLADTPCLGVFAGQTCYYPRGVQGLFPNDQDLAALNAEGYLGIPLFAATGQVVGHLAALDDKPLERSPNTESLLRIFAARAGAELERLRAEDELRRALAEVGQLKNRLHAENLYLQEEIRREHNFDEIVGNSPALLTVLNQIERVAPTDATVLILGETGTGKELVARALHNLSRRARRPLVKVNCGAISAGLVESELFGHVKGAFTGAVDKRTGRFELADGGTLFLDEVGELPPDTQVKLLRVLQEGEFEPVGSSRTVKVDVRVIAATNRNLEQAVGEGRFRADLYYRLNVLPLTLPALRERASDIPALAVFFADRYARKFGKDIEGIAQDTMNLLVNYAWPGNVRELQNIIERGVVLAHSRTLTLDANLLPAHARAAAAVAQTPPPPVAPPAPVAATFDDAQRQHLLAVLQQTNWLIEGDQGAAKILNLHPNTLRSRLKKLGLQRPAR
jgi:predicted ATPase/transcriptional regulator with GAF, ATPase, and Fis domain